MLLHLIGGFASDLLALVISVAFCVMPLCSRGLSAGRDPGATSVPAPNKALEFMHMASARATVNCMARHVMSGMEGNCCSYALYPGDAPAMTMDGVHVHG